MENKNFEQLLNELAKIVKDLESGNLSLEESVNKYKEGISLSIECKKRLEQAREVVVTKMTETSEEKFN
ncbi:MAG: exodeoxyribonuclease VII small subunit [Bacilli bacterium]|jgi:exodeoxyribonuclease VII small subunit|nr:exodeoxyribonuclease VII small subunit [Acholeplasmataceae bacterium]